MGTEILRPQDCLSRRIGLPRPAVYARRRNETSDSSNGSGHESRKPDPSHGRRRGQSEPSVSERPRSGDPKSAVTILRRGEAVDLRIRSSRSEASLRNLGHEPGTISRDTRIVVDTRSEVGSAEDVLYAGSAFAVSPAPRSLPFPSFSKKKKKQRSQVGVDDSATRDLRRLLRLD